MRWSMIVALALLAGCDSGEPEQGQIAAEPEDAGIPATEAAPQPEPSAAQYGATGIPAQMQGRWGLVPADCEPGRADAKGLMVVDEDSLEFYESVASLDETTERTDQTMRATFDFTGEGMSWERDMTLSLGNGGETLVRREYGEDSAPEPLEYARCG